MNKAMTHLSNMWDAKVQEMDGVQADGEKTRVKGISNSKQVEELNHKAVMKALGEVSDSNAAMEKYLSGGGVAGDEEREKSGRGIGQSKSAQNTDWLMNGGGGANNNNNKGANWLGGSGSGSGGADWLSGGAANNKGGNNKGGNPSWLGGSGNANKGGNIGFLGGGTGGSFLGGGENNGGNNNVEKKQETRSLTSDDDEGKKPLEF
jgi:hypothetical protein